MVGSCFEFMVAHGFNSSIDDLVTRHPRGGLELTQVEELAKVINPVVLTQSPDSWSWTLNNSGGYTVASSRNMIDSRLLPKGDLKTRWIRYVPNKVNTFAWKVNDESLTYRFYISRRRALDIVSRSRGNSVECRD
ncbi:hypothetical protein Tco_0819891 [Tanacetum coccineum]|uniref:Reverse transcriptase zinc-binding domain-containing protein n=1 Tax=Tanacetum coccineum TaxID=301880 RepID=A0ABQ5AAW1_9ASTR